MNEYCSQEGVFLNSKGEVVYGKDPDRKVQIVAAGGCIPMDVANRYGLQAQAPAPLPAEPAEVEVEPVEVEETKEPEKKTISAAPANKAVAASSNKGKK